MATVAGEGARQGGVACSSWARRTELKTPRPLVPRTWRVREEGGRGGGREEVRSKGC